jgi:photosystem I subunit VIII
MYFCAYTPSWRFFMAAAYLPSILVPLVGLVFPALAMASLFVYIEKEQIA